jgi:hypothetical protein
MKQVRFIAAVVVGLWFPAAIIAVIASHTFGLPEWGKWLLVALGIALFPAIIIESARQEKERTTAVRAEAVRLGLEYVPHEDTSLEVPSFIRPAPPGRGPGRVSNVLSGRWAGLEVRVFDATAYEEGNGDPSSVDYSCAAARGGDGLDGWISVEPWGALGRKRKPRMWGVKAPTTPVSDPEFETRYAVLASSTQVTRRVLGEELRSWMKELPQEYGFRLRGAWVCCYTRQLDPTLFEPLLETLRAFVKRVRPALGLPPEQPRDDGA